MKTLSSKYVLAVALVALVFIPSALALSDERVRAFDSEIVVSPDGSILVTETIKVDVRGVDIKSGIYRDFPTTYGGVFSLRTKVPFTIIEVKRDGVSEPFHTEKRSNGVRVYIGRAGTYLPSDTYTYILRYQTDKQLGYFDNYDELYWNVTGNGWSFPVESATARIVPPAGIPPDKVGGTAFTGYEGATGGDYSVSIADTGVVNFATTRTLAAGEGLTVAVKWPKGYVLELTDKAQREGSLTSNLDAFISVLGVLVVLLWYAYAWTRVGRDPERGSIVAQYEAPNTISPAGARYILRMGSDDKALVAAIMSLAVKGAVTIHEQDKFIGNTYSISRGNVNKASLTPEEMKLYTKLLGSKRDTFKFEQKNHVVMKTAKDAFTASLKKQFKGSMFKLNRAWATPGIIISLITLYIGAVVATTITQTEFSGLLVAVPLTFILIWISVWATVLFVTLKMVYGRFKEMRSSSGFKRVISGASFVGTLFLGLFLIVPQLMGIFFIGGFTSAFVAYAVLVLVLVNTSAFWMLRAPTAKGRELMNHIEGFKMFLAVTEKERLNFHNPPDATPKLFEKMLPYAFALGVEHEWSQQFKSVLEKAMVAGEPYSPIWYVGSNWDSFHTGDFASSFGSALSGAISSASTAPGSSSGSGGGGFSGGGGGGGGGGGW